jgi:hypothetical protein
MGWKKNEMREDVGWKKNEMMREKERLNEFY